MRVGFRFTKGERARFLSHLDIVRSFERALRRGGVPVNYTQGFNPRPKLIFGDALPVGVTSRAELAYVDLDEVLSPATFVETVNAVLPPGLRVDDAWKLPAQAKASLPVGKPRRVELTFRSADGRITQAIRANAESLAASESVVVRRSKAGRLCEVDVRRGIAEITCERPRGGDLRVVVVLSQEVPAPKIRELAGLLLEGTQEKRPDWGAEKLA